MWIELAILGVGAFGYGVQRQRGLPLSAQLRDTCLPRSRFRLKQLWRDIRDATQVTGQDQLHGTINPLVQEQLEHDRNRAKQQQKLALGAFGTALLAAYSPLLNLFGTLAVLYLTRQTLTLVQRDFRRGHYLSFYAISFLMTLAMLATGHLMAAAFAAVMSSFLAGIVNRLEAASHRQIVNVFGDRPEKVWILTDDIEVQIPFQALQVGNTVVIRPGEVIPIDGLIITGEGQVDQHILTGESQPAEKKPGEEVFAATLLLSGQLFIQVQTTGDATVAAKIGEVLNHTRNYKDDLTTRGRQIADRFLPYTLGLSTVTWPILGPSAAIAIFWSRVGGMMAPFGALSVVNYLQILSRRNILVKDGRVFELLRDVDTVVFDKTGTLTLEQPTLTEIHPLEGYTTTDVLRYAAIAEYRQPHPIAKAILEKAAAEQLELPIPDEANYNLGYGIQVEYEGETIQVGSARFLQQQAIELPKSTQTLQTQADEQGHTLIYVAVNHVLAGVLTLQPTIRPEALEVIAFLQQRDIQLYIISGDHLGPTRNLAQSLGINHYFADVLPEHKADYVKKLKEQGRFVCFVGDGINDAIALKTAQVSLSLRGASSAATDTAQVVLMDGTLQKVPMLFQLGDDFEHTMRNNLVITIVPGLLTIAGVYLWGFGIPISIAIFYLSTFIGLGNIVWPLVKHQDSVKSAHNEIKLPDKLPSSTNKLLV